MNSQIERVRKPSSSLRKQVSDRILHLLYTGKKANIQWFTNKDIANMLPDFSYGKKKDRDTIKNTLFILWKKEKVKKIGRGKWVISKTLYFELNSKRINRKIKRKHKKLCSHLKYKNRRYYCPIRNIYISNTNETCTSYSRSQLNFKSPCPAYCIKKSTLLTKQKSKDILTRKKITTMSEFRQQYGSIHDPESHHYLPNLAKERKRMISGQ